MRAGLHVALTLRGGELRPGGDRSEERAKERAKELAEKVERQERERVEALQAGLAAEPYGGEFAGPEVWVEEDLSHK